MTTGDLRHIISFEQVRPASELPNGELPNGELPAPAPDSNTASRDRTKRQWTDFPGGNDVWASLRPATAREIEMHEAIEHQVTHVITIRYRPDIRTEFRIRKGHAQDEKARYFQIAGMINVEERGEWLKITCYETTDKEAVS